MIESTAFRGADVTRSPTGTMSTRQLGAKHSITKRSTRGPLREVRLTIMARPCWFKAYRAVYSCLLARGLVGRNARKQGSVRSWLKTSGCVRVFQSCDRRTTSMTDRFHAPLCPRGPLRPGTGAKRSRAMARRDGRARGARCSFGRLAPGPVLRPAGGGEVRAAGPSELDVGHNRHCHTGPCPACSLHCRMRCARAGRWRRGAVPLRVGGWEDGSRTQLHRSQTHVHTALSSRGLSSPRHRWPVTKSLNPQTASR